jgi:hypothetical protein
VWEVVQRRLDGDGLLSTRLFASMEKRGRGTALFKGGLGPKTSGKGCSSLSLT